MFFSLLTLVKKLSHVTIFAAVCISGAIDKSEHFFWYSLEAEENSRRTLNKSMYFYSVYIPRIYYMIWKPFAPPKKMAVCVHVPGAIGSQ